MQSPGGQGTADTGTDDELTGLVATAGPGAKRFAIMLLLILVGAFGLRVVYVVTITKDDHRVYDSYWYEFEAVTIGKGQGIIDPSLARPFHKNADHPPLTSLVLAPTAKLTDGSQLAMKLTMALLGTGVVLAIALVGREVAGDRAALIAAGVAAVYPNLWMNDGLLMAETLSALLVAVAILLAYKLLRRPAWKVTIGLGLVCGLAMLARAELALLIPFVALPACLVVMKRSRRQGVTSLLVIVLLAALTVSPWVVRNLTTFERPVLLSAGDGLTLLGANCHDTYGGEAIGFWLLTCASAGGHTGDVSVRNERDRRLAFDYMGSHPGRLGLTAAARLGRVWSVYKPIHTVKYARGEGRPLRLSMVGVAMFYVLFPVAIIGAFVLRRRRVPIFPLVATFAIVTLTALVFYGLVRFRVPAEVAIVVLVGVALDEWYSRRHGLSAREEPALSAPG